jgi:hypothetical protein
MKTRGVLYDAGTGYGTGLIRLRARRDDNDGQRRYVRAAGDPHTEGYFDASG